MNHYSLVCEIGSGSSGSVLLAKDKITHELYAIKKCHLSHFQKVSKSTNDAYKRVVNEVNNVLPKLHHENIIKCKEYFIEDSFLYSVLEYARCGDLQCLTTLFIDDNLLFPESTIQYILISCLHGLEYIHSKGIVHRDIKPQNILLTHDGYVKICDFSVAKEFDLTSVEKSCIGTLQYMAPEILNGTEYDQSADIWSLGCVLYELIWRKPIYANEVSTQLISQRIQTWNVQSVTWPDYYSSKLCSIVASMLVIDRTKRPTVQDLLQLPYIRTINEKKGKILMQLYATQSYFRYHLKQSIPKELRTKTLSDNQVAYKLQYDYDYIHKNSKGLQQLYQELVATK